MLPNHSGILGGLVPVRPGSPQWPGGSVPATSTLPPQMCSGGTQRAPRSGVPHEGHPEHRVGSAQGLGPGGHHPQWGSRCCTPEMGLLGQGPRPRSRPSKQGLLIHTMALLSFQTISFNSAFNAKSVFFFPLCQKRRRRSWWDAACNLESPSKAKRPGLSPAPPQPQCPRRQAQGQACVWTFTGGKGHILRFVAYSAQPKLYKSQCGLFSPTVSAIKGLLKTRIPRYQSGNFWEC